jgi:hypothetical protein
VYDPVADCLQSAKEARGAEQVDRLERRLAVVGRRSGLYRPLATLTGEFNAAVPADPVHDPAGQRPLVVDYLKELELQRRAAAVDGQDPHAVARRKYSGVALNS